MPLFERNTITWNLKEIPNTGIEGSPRNSISQRKKPWIIIWIYCLLYKRDPYLERHSLFSEWMILYRVWGRWECLGICCICVEERLPEWESCWLVNYQVLAVVTDWLTFLRTFNGAVIDQMGSGECTWFPITIKEQSALSFLQFEGQAYFIIIWLPCLWEISFFHY